MNKLKITEMGKSTQSVVSNTSKYTRAQSAGEVLNKTKFYKHYRPDDSFFEKKSKSYI
jgi:hypothetical protein